MQDDGMVRVLGRVVVTLCILVCSLVASSSALANAPDPIPGTTRVDSLVVHPDGSRTVTVEGQWIWAASDEPNCPADRDGVGYQVAWFDNTVNPIGAAGSPDGILYVGDASDNIVHSLDVLGGSRAFSAAFWDGVPASYFGHLSPTAADAAEWYSNCGSVLAGGGTATGTWGPISHTYAATYGGPLTFCPVMYDPHGVAQSRGGYGESQGDITAGGHGHNADNSYEGNGVNNACAKVTVPVLTTSASSGSVSGSIHDSATLSGASAPTGTITFRLYSDASCTALLDSSAVAVAGNGTYSSPSYVPGTPGNYYWVATYSGDAGNASVHGNCGDAGEASQVGPASSPVVSPAPAIQVVKLQREGSSGGFTRGPIYALVGTAIEYEIQVTNTGNTPLTLSLHDPLCATGTLSGPVQLIATLSGEVLLPGGEVQYTCSHLLTGSDASPFINTVSVSGQPPIGPPVVGTASVRANKQAVGKITIRRCGRGKIRRAVRRHGRTVRVCAARRHVVVRRRRTPPVFTG